MTRAARMRAGLPPEFVLHPVKPVPVCECCEGPHAVAQCPHTPHDERDYSDDNDGYAADDTAHSLGMRTAFGAPR